MRVHATLCVAAALVGSAVEAQPALEWNAPPGCPGAEQAAAEVEQLRSPGTAAQARVEIQRETSLQLSARVTVRVPGRTQEQVLRDADCAALTHAAALVVAMAFEPVVRRARPQPMAADVSHSERPRAREVHASEAARAPAVRADTAVALRPSSVTQPAAESGEALADARQGGSSQAPVRANAEPAGSRSAARARDLQPAAATQTDDRRELAANIPARDAAEPLPPSAADAPDRIVLPVPLAEPGSASPGPHVMLTPPASPHDRAHPPATSSAGASASALYGFLSASGGLSSGVMPSLAPGLQLSAGILTRAYRAALRVGYSPTQHAQLEGLPSAGGHVTLTTAAAEAGLRLQIAPLEVPVVAGFEAGVFSADADGVSQHATRHEAWLATFAGSGIALHWADRFALALRAEGLVALRRPGFALASADGAQRLVFHRPSALGARVYLTLELQFL